MTRQLDFIAKWERLEEGSQEERACFGMVIISYGNLLLSEGIDGFVGDRRRDGPLVSNYHLAEWLAWNWWRLTAEPKWPQETSEWAFSHRLSTIGEGYLWPNVTIWSDLERTCLVARPCRKQGFASFRFTANSVVVLPTNAFARAFDQYIGQVQSKLRADNVSRTNLDRIWNELCEERASPDLTRRRRLEALLGLDPDESRPEVINQLMADSAKLGHHAIDEMAAYHPNQQPPPSAEQINSLAVEAGTAANPSDAVQLSAAATLPTSGEVPAWQRGYAAAQALRKQECLGDAPLTDQRLAELAGVTLDILDNGRSGDSFSFALDDNPCSGQVVLRPKWHTGRRFELARLLGDRIAVGTQERLLPATRAYTYRQKLQRAFAAELLCPFEALIAKLSGDYSDEAIENAAGFFKVSPLTVSTLLVNHDLLPREVVEDDLETPAAA